MFRSDFSNEVSPPGCPRVTLVLKRPVRHEDQRDYRGRVTYPGGTGTQIIAERHVMQHEVQDALQVWPAWQRSSPVQQRTDSQE